MSEANPCLDAWLSPLREVGLYPFTPPPGHWRTRSLANPAAGRVGRSPTLAATGYRPKHGRDSTCSSSYNVTLNRPMELTGAASHLVADTRIAGLGITN